MSRPVTLLSPDQKPFKYITSYALPNTFTKIHISKRKIYTVYSKTVACEMWQEHIFMGYNTKIQKDWIKELPPDCDLTNHTIGWTSSEVPSHFKHSLPTSASLS